MSLVTHAEYELRRAGLFDKDSDYGGELAPVILEVVKKFAEAGHSGMSASIAISILERLLRFKTLTPITSNPDEWMLVSDKVGFEAYQSTRQPAIFSVDGGKSWYDLDDPEKKNFPERLK